MTSPRLEARRNRASSASEYFGRRRVINGESGSVTWVRVTDDDDAMYCDGE